ncbi:MAG: hypothetical protein GXO82_03975 [Chlorobi bacterium]|nr:hypothetical protein [Chlorobiota bacterium]
MKRRLWKSISPVAVLVLVIIAPVLSQPRFDNPDVRKRIEEIRRFKLIDYLDLEEEQAVRFVTREKDFSKEEKRREEKRNKVIMQLKKAVEEGVSEDELRSLIDQYVALGREMAEARLAYFRSLGDLLTVEQQAKYLLFERKFKDEIRNIIRNWQMERRKRQKMNR